MNYKNKQEWIEAVMADTTLTPAAKVYAYGIFQHMYGEKDTSFPGAKALAKATGLNDSQFYKYNKALRDAGYLEVTRTEGRSNSYRLTEPTSVKGGYLPSEEVGSPSEEVGGTSTEGTNTTSNTTKESTNENPSKGASAPVDLSLPREDVPTSLTSLNPSFEEVVTPLLDDSRFSLTETGDAVKKKHRTQREQEMAHARRVQALTDLGIDLDGEW